MKTSSHIGILPQANFTEGEKEEWKQKKKNVLVQHCGLYMRLVSLSFQISNFKEDPEMAETTWDNPCGPAAFTLSGHLWVWGASKPPLGQITSWKPPSEMPELLNMGKHSFFSWTPNLYILSRLPEAFLLCCRQKSNTSWAMEEVTCSQGEVATWDHWFFFSQLSGWQEQNYSRSWGAPLRQRFSPLSSSLHQKANGFTAGESYQQKTNQKQMLGTVQQGISWPSSSLAKNSKVGVCFTLQNRCDLRI